MLYFLREFQKSRAPSLPTYTNRLIADYIHVDLSLKHSS